MHANDKTFQARQRGSVLVITMLFLIAISMLAVSSMQSSNIGLYMAQNEESRITAAQGAQALADAIVANPAATPVVGGSGFTICTPGETDCDRSDLPITNAILAATRGEPVPVIPADGADADRDRRWRRRISANRRAQEEGNRGRDCRRRSHRRGTLPGHGPQTRVDAANLLAEPLGLHVLPADATLFSKAAGGPDSWQHPASSSLRPTYPAQPHWQTYTSQRVFIC